MVISSAHRVKFTQPASKPKNKRRQFTHRDIRRKRNNPYINTSRSNRPHSSVAFWNLVVNLYNFPISLVFAQYHFYLITLFQIFWQLHINRQSSYIPISYFSVNSLCHRLLSLPLCACLKEFVWHSHV